MKNTFPEIEQAEDLDTLQCLEEMRQEPLEFRRLDEFLAKFNQPAARRAMDAAFNATPEELGRAAAEAARRRC